MKDRKFLDRLREKPCLITGKMGSEHETIDPAHFRWGTDGGIGKKPSDCFANPLLHSQHMRQGRIGETTFWLEAVNAEPLLLRDFIKDALRWRYFMDTGKVPDA